MIYVANHYLRVSGTLISPGEAFDADYTEEQERRLISKGAISASGMTLDEVIQQSAECRADEETHDEALEETSDEIEPEAPEIDVMDGIAVDSDDKKPKAKGRRKS